MLVPVPELDSWLDMNGRRVRLDLERLCWCGHRAGDHADRWSDADAARCDIRGCECEDFDDEPEGEVVTVTVLKRA